MPLINSSPCHQIYCKGICSPVTVLLLIFLDYLCPTYLQAGITLLLINLGNQTEFNIVVQNSMNIKIRTNETTNNSIKSFAHGLKKTVSWVGSKASDGTLFREEYHLTPKDDDLRSKTMLLNGKPLRLTHGGDVPSLNPVLVHEHSPTSIAPLSIKFIVLPYFEASGCI